MTIRAYYYRPWRTWCAYRVNANGDQIGDAAYGHSRAAAIANRNALSDNDPV